MHKEIHLPFHYPSSGILNSDESYFEFIHCKTLRSGIYTLPAGAVDPQKPHTEDELYYVISGSSSMVVGDEILAVAPGDVIFVPAFLEHRFFDINEDLQLLVFFSKMPVSSQETSQ